MRKDAFGFFWDDTVVDKKGKQVIDRPLPAIPDNGWVVKDFPRLENAKLIGLDTETKDPDLLEKGPGVRRGAHIVGISVATEDAAWYFPMRHEVGGEFNLPPENVIAWAQDNLTRPNQPKVGANLLYDLDFLAQEGVDVEGPFYDIQVSEALINENLYSYALDAIAERHLGTTKVKHALEEWVWTAYGEKNYRQEIWRSPPQLVGPYAEGDASLPILIHQRQQKVLELEGLLPIWNVEVSQIPLLLAMRRRGVPVDLKRTKQIEGKLVKSIEKGKKELAAMVGFDFDADNKKDLIRLFEEQGLKYPKTDKGNPSFTKEFLQHHPHPACKKIVEQRKWEKFLSTFIHGYIYDLHVNGRIHCQFNQLKNDDYGTIARYSSSLPNLQNIPRRDEYWGPMIRSIFVPEDGEDWYKLDWSQIEYRLLVNNAKHPSAELARERYRSDPSTDFHKWVAEISGVKRDPAKNINFGLVYGLGEESLAVQLGLTLDEARKLFELYHMNLPFVSQARKDASAAAASLGYVTTLLGRRRRFDLWEPRFRDGSSGNKWAVGLPLEQALAQWGNKLRRAYTHKALNGEIQGGAADLMKKAMEQVWFSEATNVLGAPLLTVHDELDYSVPRSQEGIEAITEVKHLMETCVKLTIPIIADMKHGKNWGVTE